MSATSRPKLAIIGGTGDLGSGLARCWSKAGYPVILGSRTAEKARESAAAFAAEGFAGITGAGNAEAAAEGDIAIVAVPFANFATTLADIREAVKGKIVVSAVVPLMPPKVSVVQLPAEGSAALIARASVDESTRVVGAFHNVGSQKLHGGGKADCDVLVFGDDVEARRAVIELANAVSNRGVDGGALANAAAAEALTSVLISINRTYKVKAAGIAITGIA